MAVVGGGISGLVIAFELSEEQNIDIIVIESSNHCGGKMKGYFNKKIKRFEEHSIRALGSTYFDVLYRAGLLYTLSAVGDYIFYGSKSESKVAVNRTGSLKLETFKDLVDIFNLSMKDMLSLAKK
ncbi:NAD(P)-binding protein [Mesonia sp. MT50]|uniref:NAD(P)-binding protein n=1 Tax=Mesonia profundi TaxID=3070998 RepID=A0ABU1A2Q1_9FLAO|nr:NAD(P)-binding protein [Mesonia profundi]MDQ7917967.1 NAD(P)-binding protein [Mesonia profundi]